jgi:hypothetical protein
VVAGYPAYCEASFSTITPLLSGEMMGDYYGMDTEQIGNRFFTLEYLRDAGPRIVRLIPANKPSNIFAEVPHNKIHTRHGLYKMYGGHRLWHAPEDMDRTYIPDNEPISIEHTQDGVILSQNIEKNTGILKKLQITLHSDQPTIEVLHTLENHGVWPIRLSAWAITQVPLGGIAFLPLNKEKTDQYGLLPNQNLVFWPYSRLNDPRICFHSDFIQITGKPLEIPFKFGYANNMGWLAYLRDNILFIKHFFPEPGLPYPDMGCSAEIYCNDQFLETETLSCLNEINPGQSLKHLEIWEIHTVSDSLNKFNDISSIAAKRKPKCI